MNWSRLLRYEKYKIVTIQFLKGILSNNTDYAEYVQNLKDTLPAHERCHAVFSENAVLYRCKTCATGDSSCLCSECFENGNHEVNLHSLYYLQGHDYKRYFSSCGGCCDCGDCESWAREGWCEKHIHAVYHKDSDLLMDDEYAAKLQWIC